MRRSFRLGATEQHGRHLPLGADMMQGIDICRPAAAVLARDGVPLLVGPATSFGPPPFLSESPKAHPGAIAVSNDTTKHYAGIDLSLEFSSVCVPRCLRCRSGGDLSVQRRAQAKVRRANRRLPQQRYSAVNSTWRSRLDRSMRPSRAIRCSLPPLRDRPPKPLRGADALS